MKEAEKDDRIMAVTAAMPSGTGLDIFEKASPDRMFDGGIAEWYRSGLPVTLGGAA